MPIKTESAQDRLRNKPILFSEQLEGSYQDINTNLAQEQNNIFYLCGDEGFSLYWSLFFKISK